MPPTPRVVERRPELQRPAWQSRSDAVKLSGVAYEKTDRGDDAAAGEVASDPNDAHARSPKEAAGTKAALSKGTILLHARSFVVGRFGETGWRAVLDRLPADDRQAFSAILPITWYPHEADARLLRAIDDVLGDGDKKLLVELGRFEAEQDLRRIHRMFLRFANPAYVLEKAAHYWSRFHNTGRWTVERKENSASGTLFDWNPPDELNCIYLGGYIVRMFELVGARQVLVRHSQCRCRGDRGCTFEGTWSP